MSKFPKPVSAPPGKIDPDLHRYIEEVARSVVILSGLSKGPIVSSVPTTDEIDEGEIQFYESGSTRRLYTKINGSVRYVNLT